MASFELPNLDRKSYDQLLAELIRRIPEYTRQWTDYNDSDPGITLLQMLAWLDESLLYQANAIPLQTEQNYLRWVLGLAFSTNQTAYSQAAVAEHDDDFLALRQVLVQMEQGAAFSKEDLHRAVLGYVAQPYMALNLSSVETLAMQTNRVIAQTAKDGEKPLLVKRAYAQDGELDTTAWILSSATPQYQYPAYANHADATAARKLLMVVASGDAKAEKKLLDQVTAYLAPRAIAGNRVVVRPAQFTDINLALTVACAPNTRIEATLSLLFARLFKYFLPCEGGLGGEGSQYGKAPSVAEIRQLVAGVAGVDRIEALDFNFVPTLQLDVMATLDVDAQLASLPPGTPAMFYRGLPRLRCLDVTARSSQA